MGNRGRLFRITLNPSTPFPETSVRPTPPLGRAKEPSAREGHLNLSPGRPRTGFSSDVPCFCCVQSAQIGTLPLALLDCGDVSAITTHQISHEGARFSLANSSAGHGRIFRGRRRNSERSSRSCGTLHAHIERGLRARDQGLTGTLASNGGKQRRFRRSADRPALRAVRNASGEHLPLLRRTAIGWRGCCFVSQPRYAQRTRRSRRERMVSSPSMRIKNAIGKTNPPAPRSARAQSGPSPDQRFAGNRAHGRSKCEGARSSALLFRARTRESVA